MSEVKKLPVAEQAKVRKDLYDATVEALGAAGYETETVSDGALIHLGEGQYALLKIAIKDPEKFDLDIARADYAEKQQKAAERAAKAAETAATKAAKEAEKAAKAAAKAEKSE